MKTPKQVNDMYKRLLVIFRETGKNEEFGFGRNKIHLNDLLGFGEDENLWLKGTLEENFKAIDEIISHWPGVPNNEKGETKNDS